MSPEFQDPHHLGEILVAAVMRAFLGAWLDRLRALGTPHALDLSRFAEQGAVIANELLTICVRALDYCPPASLTFPDFASALLTAHYESTPADEYHMRPHLRESFAAYGIRPASTFRGEPGVWEPAPAVTYEGTNVALMRRDSVEVFRFIWRNRAILGLDPDADTEVLSVRTSLKPVANEFPHEETAVEYLQTIRIRARQLARIGVRKPGGMPDDTVVTLYGGGTLIFDAQGRLEYAITNSVRNRSRQGEQLEYAWRFGGKRTQVGVRPGPARSWPFDLPRPRPDRRRLVR
jgi:hypothetical protein